MNTYKILGLALLMGAGAHAQTMQEAIQKTENERFAAAAGDFKNLIVAEPTNGCNYFYYGENFFDKHELDSANMQWVKGAAAEPGNALNYVGLGKTLWYKGDKAGAKVQFDKALTMTKNKNAEVNRRIAEAYINAPEKNLDEAIRLLEIAIKLDGKNEENHLLMGDALLEKTPENGGPAIKSYNKALELNPKSPRGIVRTAKLYQRAQNFKLANEKYEEAQRIDPTYAPAYRENAELNMRFNQSARAIENWKKYLELNNSDEARYRYASSLFLNKQYCEVIPELEGLQQRGFNNFFVQRMSAYSYVECNTDPQAASKGLLASDRFFKMVSPDSIIALDYKYRGLLYSKSGNDSLAVLELERASTVDENTARDLSGDIGRLYMKMKKYDGAIAAYEKKMNGTSGNLSAQEQFELGRAYYFGPQNYVLADSAFSRLAVLSPTYAPAYLWRARANYKQDPKNEKWAAKMYYEKYLELIKPEDRALPANKSMVMEAAKYLGDYYVNSTGKDALKAKEYWTIVRDIDPADKQAKTFFASGK
jgi:tetratricopeptide (TPR) repeat protein